MFCFTHLTRLKIAIQNIMYTERKLDESRVELTRKDNIYIRNWLH